MKRTSPTFDNADGDCPEASAFDPARHYFSFAPDVEMACYVLLADDFWNMPKDHRRFVSVCSFARSSREDGRADFVLVTFTTRVATPVVNAHQDLRCAGHTPRKQNRRR